METVEELEARLQELDRDLTMLAYLADSLPQEALHEYEKVREELARRRAPVQVENPIPKKE